MRAQLQRKRARKLCLHSHSYSCFSLVLSYRRCFNASSIQLPLSSCGGMPRKFTLAAIAALLHADALLRKREGKN